MLLFTTHTFPRSYERGSIEAFQGRRVRVSGQKRFHVRMNVAQLKLKDLILDGYNGTVFPRSYERGSIEAATGAIASGGTTLVSTFV